MLPEDCWGLIPIPLLVITAVVAGLTLNSSATNLTTAVKGASSGTESLALRMMKIIVSLTCGKGTLGQRRL